MPFFARARTMFVSLAAPLLAVSGVSLGVDDALNGCDGGITTAERIMVYLDRFAPSADGETDSDVVT